MDLRIGVKTKMKLMDDKLHIAYFGFYDYEAEKDGDVEPYRHIDGDLIETERTIYGYRVTIHDAYDLTRGVHLTNDVMKNLKLMFVEFDDDHWYERKNVEHIWMDDGNDWSDVINFM